jgi:hypothetical protein
LFSLRRFTLDFEADGSEKRIQIIADVLIQAIQ